MSQANNSRIFDQCIADERGHPAATHNRGCIRNNEPPMASTPAPFPCQACDEIAATTQQHDNNNNGCINGLLVALAASAISAPRPAAILQQQHI